MALTFADMKTELGDRGFAHLSDTRRGYYVNAARAELDRMYLWPWREKSAIGTSPLSITDLGTVEAVINTSLPGTPRLARVDYLTLLDTYGDLSTSDSPLYYYIAWPSGTPEVVTYPANSNTIGVQYWRVTPDLTGTQTPASPDQAHYTIVDLAVRQASLDAGDFFSSSIAQGEADRKISQLLDAYPPGIADGPDSYVGVTGASEDW